MDEVSHFQQGCQRNTPSHLGLSALGQGGLPNPLYINLIYREHNFRRQLMEIRVLLEALGAVSEQMFDGAAAVSVSLFPWL